MLLMQAWYETIFSGVLEIGLDRNKIYQLEDETFLYLQAEATTNEECEVKL